MNCFASANLLITGEAVVVFFLLSNSVLALKQTQVVTVRKACWPKFVIEAQPKLNIGTRGHEVLNLSVDREMTRNLSRYD